LERETLKDFAFLCKVKMQDSTNLSVSEKLCQEHLKRVSAYHLFATTMSQLKICYFSGEPFKGFEVL